jgi:hypothetical protein
MFYQVYVDLCILYFSNGTKALVILHGGVAGESCWRSSILHTPLGLT